MLMREVLPWILAIAALASLASLGCAPSSGAPIRPGTVFSARDDQGATVTLRVDDVTRDGGDSDGDVYLYQLSTRDPAGGWRDYCVPDREGKRLAIPLLGAWDAARSYVASGTITFACTSGALAKCVRWGYKPWKSFNGVSLSEYHQACVRMTPADYCGDGTPHTRDGTTIGFWDHLGLRGRASVPGMVFEAAWSPRGATYLRKPRFGEPIADLAAACPERLRGHTQLDAPNLDDQSIAQRWPEALIFTDSFVQTELP